MRTGPSKSRDVLLATELEDELWLKVLFTRAMVKSWTIQVTIAPVHWTVCQHAWLVGTQIEFVNLSVHSAIHLLR